jgi:tRNA-(ms[2]io[6]A)-hydroxylase
VNHAIDALHRFLPCPTPVAWLEQVPLNLPTLLVDHARCEKKAAATAISLMFRYPEHRRLQRLMSRLAREELKHFDQVLRILQDRGWPYRSLSPSRYAGELRRQGVRTQEPQAQVDLLLIGALIEARSCERFQAMIPYVDEGLGHFFQSLLASEARHYQGYLSLADEVQPGAVAERLPVLKAIEQSLIEGEDTQFRFHSGVPAR